MKLASGLVCVCGGGIGCCGAKAGGFAGSCAAELPLPLAAPAFRAQSAVRTSRRLAHLPLLSLLTQGTAGAPSWSSLPGVRSRWDRQDPCCSLLPWVPTWEAAIRPSWAAATRNIARPEGLKERGASSSSWVEAGIGAPDGDQKLLKRPWRRLAQSVGQLVGEGEKQPGSKNSFLFKSPKWRLGAKLAPLLLVLGPRSLLLFCYSWAPPGGLLGSKVSPPH